jgi:hypothetical protein
MSSSSAADVAAVDAALLDVGLVVGFVGDCATPKTAEKPICNTIYIQMILRRF